MTDEEKKQMQLLYDMSKLSIQLSPEQAALLQKLEDRFIADEIMPALGSHILPLMKQLHGDFTLQVFQAAGQQRAYIKRGDNEPPFAVSEPPVVETSDGHATFANADETKRNVEETKRTRSRPNFRFSMVGIKPGEWVTFIPTGLRVKVVSDNKVEYDGQTYKLSPFVVKFLPDDKRNSKNAYQGPKYFAYQGHPLDDLRPDTKKKKRKSEV